MSELPVVVIGAGPQGLAAAAHLLERGLEPLVIEAGDGPASAVAEWGHVRLFSPWPELVDTAAGRLLAPSGWTAPRQGYPTGAEWIAGYLRPLAEALGGRVLFGARVTGVSRKGRDRLVDAGPGRPAVHRAHHRPGRERAQAGGAGGHRRVGHVAAAEPRRRGRARLPSASGPPRDGVWSGTRSRTSALRSRTRAGTPSSWAPATRRPPRSSSWPASPGRNPGTRVTWALRRATATAATAGSARDELPERGALGIRAAKAVDEGTVTLVTGFRTERIRQDSAGKAVLAAEDGSELAPADAVVVLTGFRPDLEFLSELRLDLDPVLQAPRRIAPSIDPNVHSCGTATPTLAADLAQPEPGLYLVGMKSYGRAPTFLAMTGYEQVRSVAAELAGDHEAAARAELVLPDTGVCGGAGLFDDPDGASSGACCAPAPRVLKIGLAPAGS